MPLGDIGNMICNFDIVRNPNSFRCHRRGISRITFITHIGISYGRQMTLLLNFFALLQPVRWEFLLDVECRCRRW